MREEDLDARAVKIAGLEDQRCARVEAVRNRHAEDSGKIREEQEALEEMIREATEKGAAGPRPHAATVRA